MSTSAPPTVTNGILNGWASRWDGPFSNVIPWIVVSSDNLLEWAAQSQLTMRVIVKLNTVLTWAGVPQRSLITPEELCLSVFATLTTLVLYFVFFGKRHLKKRKVLAEDLKLAQMQVHYLQEKLLLAETEQDRVAAASSTSTGEHSGSDGRKSRPVRIFMDGAFDMMHYGHMNAFRLGRSLGTQLVVGVNSDETLRQCKGAPLMNDQERLTMVGGCKFVDEVVPGCPYVMNSDYLDYVMKKYKIDYVIHGDDPCIVDGKDVYQAAKERGKYRSIPRTEGVSTTDIVGRMLLMTTEHHHKHTQASLEDAITASCKEARGPQDGHDASSLPSSPTKSTKASAAVNESNGAVDQWPTLLGHRSKFLTTSRMLRLFSAGVKNPTEDMRVIYMDGAWDMFHPGHVAVLKEAKLRGDYLIVGVHGDAAVNRRRGFNMPLMNLHERVLSVQGCKFVDDVLIDAPPVVTPEMVASLNIAEVVHGSRSDNITGGTGNGNHGGGNGSDDSDDDVEGKEWLKRYAVPRSLKIFTIIQSPTDFSLENIVSRIQRNQQTFQAKIERKKKQEHLYYQDRYYGNENERGNENKDAYDPALHHSSSSQNVNGKWKKKI